MTARWIRPALILLAAATALAACDSMAPQATPVAVIVTSDATRTPTPRATETPTPTRTLIPSATPDFSPTPTAFPCPQETGEIIEILDNPSPTAGGENLRYLVYIPPCYFNEQGRAEKRFPYVILIHGLSYREQQWQDIGAIDTLDAGIRLGTLPPMILVMPYFGAIGQLNSFPPDPSYETVILDELLPAVEGNFCTWNDADHRAIGGISRGGFWAITIAFRHPDIFGSAGGHSAFYPDSTFEVPEEFNPLVLAETSETLREAGLRLYLDNGASDSAASSQRDLSERLSDSSIPHTYAINPVGEHNNEYWSAHVSDYLAFYGENWPRNYDELPSCLE
jgi:enterochelin esterase-like enzyme